MNNKRYKVFDNTIDIILSNGRYNFQYEFLFYNKTVYLLVEWLKCPRLWDVYSIINEDNIQITSYSISRRDVIRTIKQKYAKS